MYPTQKCLALVDLPLLLYPNTGLRQGKAQKAEAYLPSTQALVVWLRLGWPQNMETRTGDFITEWEGLHGEPEWPVAGSVNTSEGLYDPNIWVPYKRGYHVVHTSKATCPIFPLSPPVPQ